MEIHNALVYKVKHPVVYYDTRVLPAWKDWTRNEDPNIYKSIVHKIRKAKYRKCIQNQQMREICMKENKCLILTQYAINIRLRDYIRKYKIL